MIPKVRKTTVFIRKTVVLGIMFNFDRMHLKGVQRGALNIVLGCNFFRFCTPPHSSCTVYQVRCKLSIEKN